MAFLRGYVVKNQTALLGVKKGQKWPKMAKMAKNIRGAKCISNALCFFKTFHGIGEKCEFCRKMQILGFQFQSHYLR